jgi:hypothetical protein
MIEQRSGGGEWMGAGSGEKQVRVRQRRRRSGDYVEMEWGKTFALLM